MESCVRTVDKLFPSLCQFHESFITAGLEEDVRELHTGIFELSSPFTDVFAKEIIAEVRHFETECCRAGISYSPPSVFVHSGALLAEMGLSSFTKGFVASWLSPLVERLFPATGGLRPDDVLASVLFYSADRIVAGDVLEGYDQHVSGMDAHCDDSCITLDICLGEAGFQGGDLVFKTSPNLGDAPCEDDELVVEQKPNRAVLFDGSITHWSKPLAKGRRANLVFWCISKRREVPLDAFGPYMRYLSHIGSREREAGQGPRAISFEVPAQYLRAGKRRLPPRRLVARLGRRVPCDRKALKGTANVNNTESAASTLALNRIDVATLIMRFIAGNVEQDLSVLVLHKVCWRWHGFFVNAARSAVQRLAILPGSREVITLQIGGCGTALGSSMWKLFCFEHGLDANGHLDGNTDDMQQSTFFGQMMDGRWRPRCVFVDLEADSFSGLANERFALFSPIDQVCSRGSSSGLFSQRYTACKDIIGNLLCSIRRHVERCDSLQGFLLLHSASGGCGSGLTSLLLEDLSVDESKKCKMSMSVYDGRGGLHNSAEPYNSMLSSHYLLQHTDTSIVLEHNKMASMCSAAALSTGSSDYTCTNALAAQVLSSMTQSMRFDGALVTDMAEFQSNLVPYPRVHFLMAALSPILAIPRAEFTEALSVAEITNEVFSPSSVLAGCDPRNGKYMACALMFRGDVVPKDVMAAVASIKTKRTIRFVDWSPTGFKCGINYRQPMFPPGWCFRATARSILNLSNSTSIAEVFAGVESRFDSLYSQRAFVHHLVAEGMEEAELLEAREDVKLLQQEYEEMNADTYAEDDEDADEF